MDGALRRGPLTDLTQYINPDINNTRVQNAIGSHAFGFQRKSPKPDTYKTVMCQAWLESMKCAFGENCKFAHGEHELRPVRFNTQIRNNLKYKTKLCDKYTTSGICPYGSRCLFIHPAPTKPVKNTMSTTVTNQQTINNSEPPILQQQLDFLRSQYGPNSLPDFGTSTQVQSTVWPQSAFFDAGMPLPMDRGPIGPRSVSDLASTLGTTVGAGSTSNQVMMSRRSFSTSSAPSSAYGSSASLGHWPWSDDLTVSISPPVSNQFSGFHQSLPAFVPRIMHGEDESFSCCGTEEQGEQLARSLARVLDL